MPLAHQRGHWRIWCRTSPSDLNRIKHAINCAAFFAVLGIVAMACGTAGEDRSEVEAQNRGPYAVATDYVQVTPTADELPDGWWNPIDDKQLELIDRSLMGIRMWGNCVWYHDDPTPKTEAAVRSSLSDVIDSPIAEQIGLIETADLGAVCEESAAVADFPIQVTDGRQAAMASELMVDLLDSCVSFYASPDAPLAYRIAITFIDMLWMLEQDAPRWPRRNLWGVREWCDSIVEGAVAS